MYSFNKFGRKGIRYRIFWGVVGRGTFFFFLLSTLNQEMDSMRQETKNYAHLCMNETVGINERAVTQREKGIAVSWENRLGSMRRLVALLYIL